MRTCSIDGCERKHLGKGLCSLHYQRDQGGNDMAGTEKYNCRCEECLADFALRSCRYSELDKVKCEMGDELDNLRARIKELEAQRDRYKDALERLASSEAFDLPGIIGSEVKARIEYAEAILKKEAQDEG